MPQTNSERFLMSEIGENGHAQSVGGCPNLTQVGHSEQRSRYLPLPVIECEHGSL